MEKIVLKYRSITQAVKTLKKALELKEKIEREHLLESVDDHEEIMFFTQDSCIQRFEYCTDLLWKYLNNYLELVMGVVPEIRSPKNSIRLCASMGVLTEKEAQQAIAMMESRNMALYTYRKELAQEIMARIPDYYALMEIILQKTTP